MDSVEPADAGKSSDQAKQESPTRNGSLSRQLSLLLTRMVYGVTILLVAGATYNLLTDPEFRLRRAQITGQNLLSKKTIADQIQVQGQNVFLARKAEVAEQILAHKALQSVEVTFRLPDLIHARIDEHRPAYLWKVHPTLYLVSADGIVLGTTEVEDKPTVLVDVDGQPVEIGDQVDLSALKTAAKLSVWLPKLVQIRPRYFEYSRRLGVVLPHPSGFRLAFGWQDSLEERASNLPFVLDTLEERNAHPTLVDLRFVDHYYFR